MNEIQVFDNGEFGSIRALLDENGEPCFVTKDVLGILELDRTALRKLDDDEKGVDLIHTLGGNQEVSTVTEPGFYKLVMRSRKPEAKAFQRWVTHEVLPALRRDGGYMVARDETPEQTMARAVLLAQQTIDRQRDRIAELEPKALFADAVAASDGTCLVGELAKMLRQKGRETESPLRGSAGVSLTCLAGRTLLLTPFTGMRHPHHASQSSTAPRRGTKREPGGPCPAARARASRRGLSVNVSVPRRRLRRFHARRCFCPPPQPSARCAHGTAPVRRGVLHRALLQVTRLEP